MIPSISIIGIAYILDLLLGDPPWLPHPIKGIGYLAQRLEMPLRRAIKNEPRSFYNEEIPCSKKERGERTAGIIFAALIIGLVYGLSLLIIGIAAHLNPVLSFILSIFFIYTSLAIKDLKVESMRVYRALEKQDIDLARKNLSFIVGRDTHNLSDKDIIRATIETIAENTVDGIISPLFYTFLGGAPLALAYKAANTLDSMVGYKNDKYRNFGWASARIDDCLNFIPARISGPLLAAASGLAGSDAINSFKIFLRDGRKNPSPNSGIPEAAMAGALQIQLGGLNYYNSTPALKPFVGNAIHPLEIRHILKSIRIAYLCSFLSLLTGVFVFYLIGRR